jgi:hypothetical protein
MFRRLVSSVDHGGNDAGDGQLMMLTSRVRSRRRRPPLTLIISSPSPFPPHITTSHSRPNSPINFNLLIMLSLPRTPQINHTRTPIPIPFQPHTLSTIIRITNSPPPTNNTISSCTRGSTVVADSGFDSGTHVAVTDGTAAVVVFAETGCGYSRLVTTED